jgi:hypothetical protein
MDIAVGLASASRVIFRRSYATASVCSMHLGSMFDVAMPRRVFISGHSFFDVAIYATASVCSMHLGSFFDVAMPRLDLASKGRIRNLVSG